MTLLPYKALTTQIHFQKPLRAYTSIFPASSLVQTETPDNDKTNETCLGYEAMFLSIEVNLYRLSHDFE